MLPELNTKEFTKYLKDIGKENEPRRHKFYAESVKHMHAMGIHMTGDDPKDLLDIKRPNENAEAKQYRLDSYKPKTKASASKATSIINRIYNDRLFSITFPEDPAQIKPEDNLQTYLNEELPLYVSLTNYFRSVFTKMHLKDPNGLVGVLPISFDVADTDLLEPIPIFYTSKELVDFKDGEYYVILRTDKDERMHMVTNQEVLIFTQSQILVFTRKKQADDFQMIFEYNHNFGFPPAIRVGGVVVDTQPPQLFESFISGVLPHWDDAVAMYSDLQASIVNHIYPEKWEFTVDCDNGCQSGKVRVEAASGDTVETNCTKCYGTGKITCKSPYDVYQVNKDALNPDAPLPTPPFGYGEKELESTELLERLTEKEIRKGFEAINMDIINDVGENQSGVAKVIDRQDLDGFLGTYSSHIFKYVLPNVILFIEMWRYWVKLGESEDAIKDYFPMIKEPTTFDVFSISLLTEEFTKLTEAGVGGGFLLGIQKDIIDKRFSDELTKNFYNTILDVDPLAHLTNEEMMTQARVIGQTEMYIHTYAKDLVEEAIAANDGFLNLPLEEKKEIIRKLAESKKPVVIPPEPVNE
jgi:hypothetical protein